MTKSPAFAVLLLAALSFPSHASDPTGLQPDADHDVAVDLKAHIAVRFKNHTTVPVRIASYTRSVLTTHKTVLAWLLYEDTRSGDAEKIAIEVYAGAAPHPESIFTDDSGLQAAAAPLFSSAELKLTLADVAASATVRSAPDKAMRVHLDNGVAWCTRNRTYAIIRRQSRLTDPNPPIHMDVDIDTEHFANSTGNVVPATTSVRW